MFLRSSSLPAILAAGAVVNLGWHGTAHADFTTVLDVPPDAIPSSIASDTQINLLPGADIPGIESSAWNAAPTNVELNITGGRISGPALWTDDGVNVRMTDGVIDSAWYLRGADVTMTGGEINNYLSVSGRFRLEGGEVRQKVLVSNSRFELAGGTTSGILDVLGSSDLEITSGRIEGHLNLNNSSNATLSGGVFESATLTTSGRFNLMGGVLGAMHVNGANIHVYGAEFLFNNLPIEEATQVDSTHTVTFGFDDLLSGVLSDGTPFQLGELLSSSLRDRTITIHTTELPPVGPEELDAAATLVPHGVRRGQTLTVRNGQAILDKLSSQAGSRVILESGGSIQDAFIALGTKIEVAGGSLWRGPVALHETEVTVDGGGIVGSYMSLGIDSTLTINNGVVRESLRAMEGSRVEIDGGELYQGARFEDSSLTLHDGRILYNLSLVYGSDFLMNGGSVGSSATISSGSRVEMRGGVWGEHLGLHAGSVFYLVGGTVGRSADIQTEAVLSLVSGEVGPDYIVANGGGIVVAGGHLDHGFFLAGTHLDLVGSGFAINGEAIDNLTYGVPTEIAARDVTLSARLLDEGLHTFDLSSGAHSLPADASLTVMTLLPGDYNRDGVVDAADYTVWRDQAGIETAPWQGADGNGDGLVDDRDLNVWRSRFGESFVEATFVDPAPVPEPSAAALSLAAFAAAVHFPRRRRFLPVSDAQTRRA